MATKTDHYRPQNVRNILQAPHHNATFSIMDQSAERKSGRLGATDRNRLALFGHVERLTDQNDIDEAAKVFGHYHKDAKAYYPGNGPHYAFWARFNVDRVYWLGGFGDTHYIGWLPLDLYTTSTPSQRKPDRKIAPLIVQQEVLDVNL